MLNANQLHQIAPKATVKPTNKTLVSYSQHRITPVGCVSLPVRYKGRAVHVKFYVVENQQKSIFSGKVCQALNLIQHVHKLDTSLQELLNPLSQEGGGGGCCSPPPLSDLPSYHFCVFAKIAIRSIYPPSVQIPMYLKKFFKNFCREKSWGVGGGGWGLQQPPVLRGKGWQQK